MKTAAYLSLGSNLGDRLAHLEEAIARLSRHGEIAVTSSFLETEPVEFSPQPWFLNCVVKLVTDLSAQELLKAALAIEESMGRCRTEKKGPREIDIDILLYGDLMVNGKFLTIPHPAMAERRFVLAPMAEIAADVQHPVLKRTMRELLASLPPGQEVRKV